jgi:hypothetical protein
MTVYDMKVSMRRISASHVLLIGERPNCGRSTQENLFGTGWQLRPDDH